jgi:glutathione synthase/RimK-type ligase-like ATP-grasp enzyme
VAETLITTSPDAVTEFRLRHGRLIYKSVSGVRSRVSELTEAHASRLKNVSSCPTQFQRMISGRDYRVHVVGDDVFACQLICDAQDYRYPGTEPLEIHAASLPVVIEESCVLLARSLGLPLAGIDLRHTPADEWFCFEVNPSPAFTFYEQSTEQPIAAAIAALLMAQTQPAGLRYANDDQEHTDNGWSCALGNPDYA